jgi:hypothetical protein
MAVGLADNAAHLILYGLDDGASLALNDDGLPVAVTGAEDEVYIFVSRDFEIRLPSDLRREGLPTA